MNKQSIKISFEVFFLRIWFLVRWVLVLGGMSVFLAMMYIGLYRHPDVPVVVDVPEIIVESPIYGQPTYIFLTAMAGLLVALWGIKTNPIGVSG